MSVIVERKCQLCGKTDRAVDVWVGGYLTIAHHKCADIAARAVELYLLYLYHEMFGIELFADHIQAVIKKEKAKLNEQRKLNEETKD